MPLPVAQNIQVLDAAAIFGGPQGRAEGDALDIRQTAVIAHRNGLLAADLEPIVFAGVMRCRHLNAAAATVIADGKVVGVRAEHADVEHIAARRQNALNQCLGQGIG